MSDQPPASDLPGTFDAMVLRAMAKWPDVPECYGWLRLDRRGRWLLQDTPIAHPRTIAFINRHYARDVAGRWYFQNGPQRVFIDLDYTPWVFVLATPEEFATHTGLAVASPRRVYVDTDGNVLLETTLGVGLLRDRDLPAFVATAQPCAATDGEVAELLARAAAGGAAVNLRWAGHDIEAAHIESGDVAARFGFVPHPRPVP